MTMRLKETPSQTAGPYVHIGCTPNFCDISGVYDTDLGTQMVNDQTKGERITITGTVFDGYGQALKDALIEIWQPDAQGLFPSAAETRGTPDPNFTGFGRSPGDMATGAFSFETIKPGPVPFRDGRMQAPFVSFWIVARGINIGLQTRMYFADEDNSKDPVLARIEHQGRIQTLLAQPKGDGIYHFDIHLQGDAETVFFDI
ncbi:protocatechuate 3,4-dioxygenase subunit alpha [Algirhabdus cladophorae]|uniref:protocatechuate 3,4-dioxygenase subunit alpha n=1 Tax=Algirhabdus cladophorae TaxID=3377108 RepID=UPI003B848C18